MSCKEGSYREEAHEIQAEEEVDVLNEAVEANGDWRAVGVEVCQQGNFTVETRFISGIRTSREPVHSRHMLVGTSGTTWWRLWLEREKEVMEVMEIDEVELWRLR